MCSQSRSVTASNPPTDATPSTPASAVGTSSPSCNGVSSTSHVPSACRRRATAASARRVLPTPPAPVSVTRRCASCNVATSASSTARPTKPVRSSGRLCGAGRPDAGDDRAPTSSRSSWSTSGPASTPSSVDSRERSSRQAVRASAVRPTPLQAPSQHPGEPLVQRVGTGEATGLGEDVGMAIARDLGVEPRRRGIEAGVGEARRLVLQGPAPLRVSEGRTTPQPERDAQRIGGGGRPAGRPVSGRVADQRGEPGAVEPVGSDLEAVARCDRDQDLVGAGPPQVGAQLGDPHPQHPPRPIDVELGPELVDQLVARHDAAGADGEERDEAARLRRPRGGLDTIDLHQQAAEDADRAHHRRDARRPSRRRRAAGRVRTRAGRCRARGRPSPARARDGTRVGRTAGGRCASSRRSG